MAFEHPPHPSSQPSNAHEQQGTPSGAGPSTAPFDADPVPLGSPHYGRSTQELAGSMPSSMNEVYNNPWANTQQAPSIQVDQLQDSLQHTSLGSRAPEPPNFSAAPPDPLPVPATITDNNISASAYQDIYPPNQPPQHLHHSQSAAYDSHLAPLSGSYPGSDVMPQFQSNNPFLKAVQQQKNDDSVYGSPSSAFTPTASNHRVDNGPEPGMPPPRPQSASSPFLETSHIPTQSLNKSHTGPSHSYSSLEFQPPANDRAPPSVPPKQAMLDNSSPLHPAHTMEYAASGNFTDSAQQQDLVSYPGGVSQSAVEPNGAPATNHTVSHDLIDLGDGNSSFAQQSDGPWQGLGRSAGTTPLGDRDGADASLYAQSDGHEKASIQSSGLTPPESSPPEPSRHTPMSESQIRQREAILAETYDIRFINWTDGSTDLRQSPVLVQNENGPCPLLALVNGLVLRTSPDVQSPLVRTLNSKEKISVSLLIYAIFDELTTYVDEESQLPDIEALSSFLTVLHTGMNVNPRLTPTPDTPGTFLETRDTNLYKTFNLPLVHGWLAPPNSEVYSALVRVAEYHEDIQLLHFRKEELEDQASRGDSLSTDELQLIQDIESIQHFVNDENATQLSRFGLEHLNRTLAPGSISILFRNDHFSTLFKHPNSQRLFTLVTDMGFSRHAEIVWESFVDINGSESELFSGDFRPVGHVPSASSLGPQNNQPGEVAEGAGARNNASGTDRSVTPSAEQMDADYAYALALQFQDEEEQRARRDQQNESSRGRSHTHTQSTGAPPRQAAQRSGRRNTNSGQPQQNVRTLIPHREPDAPGDDPNAPPPTYEQASKTPVYNPPADHPQYAGPPPRPPRPAPGGVAGPRTTSQFAVAPDGRRTQASYTPMDRLQHGYSPSFPERSSRDRRDCIVM